MSKEAIPLAGVALEMPCSMTRAAFNAPRFLAERAANLFMSKTKIALFLGTVCVF